MDRPRTEAFCAVSLDGYLARPDGAVDWLEPYQGTGEDFGFGAFFASVDLLLMGRKTYEVALALGWPYGAKPVAVLTHRPPAPRHGERFLQGPPGEVLRGLGGEGVRRVYVDGGEVIRACLRDGLLDALTLSVVPVLLGAGVPLFGEGTPPARLVLQRSQAFPAGLVQLTYGPR